MAAQPVRACLRALVAALGLRPAAGAAACWGGGDGFLQAEWPFCHEIKGGLLMYYGPDGADVRLGLYAETWTGGWSALALGGNGGMKGAHQLVVRKAGGQWVAEDRHAEGHATPALDTKQDVTLLFAREESGSTAWGVKVPMANCDLDDFPIRNVSQWIHWAHGQGHEFVYHGQERGQFHANLLNGPPLMMDTTGALAVDIRMPTAAITGHPKVADPRNPYICGIFDLEVLMPGRNSSLKHHVVKFAPYLDPASAPYVHHVILFSCDASAKGLQHNTLVTPCEKMPSSCSEMKWAWAVGSQDMDMPSNVGMPIGEGKRFLALQMHYYNPQLVPNVQDSSGVRLFVSSAPRPVDAALFVVDGGKSPGQRDPLPGGVSDLHLPSLLVPPLCTRAWTSDINVVATAYHGHLVGKRFNLVASRGGDYLGSLRHEPMYDFNHQSFEEPTLKTLSPGDELLFQCSYDTSSRGEATDFGDLTQEEMCWGAFVYYPAQAMSAASYQKPRGMRNPLSYFQAVCSRESLDPNFRNDSACVEWYSKDVMAILDEARAGSTFEKAVDLCNYGIPSGKWKIDKYTLASSMPMICPQCVWTALPTCTEADIKAHAEAVFCPYTCSQYGMSVWPDASRTQAQAPTHRSQCAGSVHKFSPTFKAPNPDGSFCSQQELLAAWRLTQSPTLTPSPTGESYDPIISSATQWSAALAHGLVGVLVLRLAK